MSNYHKPVMLKEVLQYLNIKPGKWYVDCNLGGGGHTQGILEKGGNVLGIDLDLDSIHEVSEILGEFINSGRLILEHNNFTHIEQIVKKNKITPSGILFDLGISSYQLEEISRGFSFNKDAPLDMRMDQKANTATAKDLINGLHEGELAELFWKLGEENFSKPIAKKIVEYRKNKAVESTNELANIILSVRRKSSSDRTHPATRIFQALRIAVNDELNALRESLPQAFEALEPGGRIVKNFFKEIEPSGQAKLITKKPIETSEEESLQNPRSRSGKLRVIEKTQFSKVI